MKSLFDLSFAPFGDDGKKKSLVKQPPPEVNLSPSHFSSTRNYRAGTGTLKANPLSRSQFSARPALPLHSRRVPDRLCNSTVSFSDLTGKK